MTFQVIFDAGHAKLKYHKIKKILDFTLSMALLMMVSPILIFFTMIIRLSMGKPVLFKQIRPGLNEQPFCMYKFRTMTNECDQNGCLLSDEARLTAVGRILRTTSFDELPELFNIIKGDMSLVGPRPLLMRYLTRYSPEQRRRHEVKPGLTGWAQVNGRNNISWEERFKLDVWYVDNASIRLDLKIMMMTIKKVLRREDINQQGHATMTEFKLEKR